MKELHEITARGCDKYPTKSLQYVEVKGDRRTTNNGSDSIHHDIESVLLTTDPEEMERIVAQSKNCYLECKNKFVKGTEFHKDGMCIRCHERKTQLNRD